MIRLAVQATKASTRSVLLRPLRQPQFSALMPISSSLLNSTSNSQRLFSTSIAHEYERRQGGFNDRFSDFPDRNSRGGNNNFRGRNNRNNNNRGGNNNNGPRRGMGQSDFDASRNTSKRGGPEGDGLLGMEDYARVTELKEVDLPQIAKQEASGEVEGSEDSGNDFSKVKTKLLSEHKILSQALVNSLTENRKYLSLTEVQSQTIVPILRGDSVVVRAKTGTGKTAAFAIPSIQLVLDDILAGKNNREAGADEDLKGVKAIIVSPTRELAQQIADEISAITSYGPMRDILTVCLVGGVARGPQLRHAFGGKKAADIIVATPGRLYDVLQEPGVGDHFKNLKIKVLDEADRLLDIGFSQQLHDIDTVLNDFSKNGAYQTLLFSATIDRRVREFARAELGKNAKVIDTVSADEPEAHTLVNQSVVFCDSWNEVYPATYVEISQSLKDTLAANVELQDQGEPEKVYKSIIFMPTVPSVDHFAKVLGTAFKLDEDVSKKNKPRVYALHGQMSQAARQRAADEFRKLKTPTILITTDVVARGMDFPNVSHVFQMGSPRDVASYVHRIGRTGRIGNHGNATMIITKYEKPYLKDLEKRNIRMQNVRTFKHSVTEEEEGDITSHQERLKTAFDFIDNDAEETVRIVEGILSSFAYMRKDFGVNGREYLDSHGPLTEFFNLKDHEWSPRLKESWRFHEANTRSRYWDSRSRGYDNDRTSSFASRGSRNNNRNNNYGNNKRSFEKRSFRD